MILRPTNRVAALLPLIAAVSPGCLLLHPDDAAVSSGASQRDWFLVWSDDFDGESIDSFKWNHQVFPGVDSGNSELQHYTDRPENSFVEDGKLVIVARREDYRGHQYTSARMTTHRKFDFTYGRVEARLKLPSTPGAWPALWMMPSDSEYGGWPLSGEIDIVESVDWAEEIYGTIHYGTPAHAHQGTPFAGTVEGEPFDFSQNFHTYAIEWDPGEIRWYFDGIQYGVQNDWETPGAPFPAPFDRDFHLIANLAIGGTWPGDPTAESTFPLRYEIDWIRVYQSGNRPPELEILSPEAGSHHRAGEELRVRVAVQDEDGKVTRVLLLDHGDLLAESTAPPFELVCQNVPDGCYQLTVVAEDNEGMRTRQLLPLTMGVGCPQRPFGETALALPARVEAEHFDRGLQGEAYSDRDASNNGGALRPRVGVDLNDDGAGNLYVGWTELEEWLAYTIQPATQPRRFRVSVRVAAPNEGASLQVRAGGEKLAIPVPDTGEWHAFAIVEGGVLEVPAGIHELRLEVITGGFNVDWLEFVAVD